MILSKAKPNRIVVGTGKMFSLPKLEEGRGRGGGGGNMTNEKKLPGLRQKAYPLDKEAN